MFPDGICDIPDGDKAGQLPEDMYSPLNAECCLFSGFMDAQYLNTKFNEIVGETPLIWLASQQG